jgi:hypothetical protein
MRAQVSHCTPDTLSMIFKICVIEPERIRIHRTTSRPILPLSSTGARKKGRGKTSLDGDPEFREYSKRAFLTFLGEAHYLYRHLNFYTFESTISNQTR